MVQQDGWHLGSTRMQVRSLARLSGLRIRCCCSCGLGLDCGSDLIPGLGTSYALGRLKKIIIIIKEEFPLWLSGLRT